MPDRLLQLNPVTPTPGRPLYEQVRDAVREAIDSGQIGPGDRIPSTKALSTMLSVSLVTVHRALQELVAAGVLRRGQGRGTFVHEAYLNPEHKASSMRVGLVFHAESSLADAYHGALLEGIRSRGFERGMDIVLLRYGEDWRNECQAYIYVNPFAEQLDRSPRFGAAASTRHTSEPVMVVGARVARPGVSWVDTDNVHLAAEVVGHLAGLGHRRVAFVGGGSQISNNVDRLSGYRLACERHGLEQDDKLVFLHPDWQLDETSLNALAGLLTGEDRPTAVFAAGYYFALNTYTAALRADLVIPDDLSVVSVDDPPSAAHLSPALTTMRQPLSEVGSLAIDEVYDQCRSGRVRDAHHTLRAELIIRGSTAPPEGGAQVATRVARDGLASERIVP
ncbi:MAG: GntR family transcriptional regulator [Planctomycetota bacterium]